MAQDVTVGDKEILKACKEALAERLGRDRFDVWFGSRVEWKIERDLLRLYFQDDFTRDWCYRRFYSDVTAVTNQCFDVRGRKLARSAEFEVYPGEKGQDAEVPRYAEVSGFNQPAAECRADKVESSNRCTLPMSSTDTDSLKSETGRLRVLKNVETTELEAAKGSSVSKRSEVGTGVVALPSKDDKRSAESVMPIAKQRALTWENFVTGGCNKMATATVEMVLKSPGVVTPLLVYGPCGSGKTHLVQALAQRFRQIHGARRVVYLSSEQFTNDFMEAIRGSGLPSFRRKYRDVECLILDDVQFLAGKRATLQELKHTLDTLLRQGRQVILVADRSLQELSILGPDVQARLTGGMVCPLDGLDESTRRELLGRLLAESRIKVAPKVVRELADKSSGDARVLFGLVNRLRALSLMLRGSFNEHQALEATQDLLTACQPTVRLSDIERAVCDVFGLEPKSLQAKGKTKTVSQPRMLAMFLARKYTRAAYSEIGDYFGHRRHSTVISAEKKVNEWLSHVVSDEPSSEVAKIREALRNVEASLRVG
jgi:chromosomal replication initiator protein